MTYTLIVSISINLICLLYFIFKKKNYPQKRNTITENYLLIVKKEDNGIDVNTDMPDADLVRFGHFLVNFYEQTDANLKYLTNPND